MNRIPRKAKKRRKAEVMKKFPKAANIRYSKQWGMSYGLWIDFSDCKLGIKHIDKFDKI